MQRTGRQIPWLIKTLIVEMPRGEQEEAMKLNQSGEVLSTVTIRRTRTTRCNGSSVSHVVPGACKGHNLRIQSQITVLLIKGEVLF